MGCNKVIVDIVLWMGAEMVLQLNSIESGEEETVVAVEWVPVLLVVQLASVEVSSVVAVAVVVALVVVVVVIVVVSIVVVAVAVVGGVDEVVVFVVVMSV